MVRGLHGPLISQSRGGNMSDVKTIFTGKGDSLSIERTQDVEGILQDNKELSKESDSSSKGIMRRVANIPNMVIELWMKEGINIFDMGHDPDVRKKILQRLNSPDWKYLRTHNSRL
jgi:hypothetical protein